MSAYKTEQGATTGWQESIANSTDASCTIPRCSMLQFHSNEEKSTHKNSMHTSWVEMIQTDN